MNGVAFPGCPPPARKSRRRALVGPEQMVGRTAALALVLMLVQNSGFVLVMRYSRHQQQREHTAQYSPAVVVAMQELFKLAVCFVATTVQQSGRAALHTLGQRAEVMRVLVPAACFTLQNNVLYVALSNLEPLVFQITYQIKTLLTALLSVQLLGRSLSRWQWLSQATLTLGVILAQLDDGEPAKRRQASVRVSVSVRVRVRVRVRVKVRVGVLAASTASRPVIRLC